MCGIFQVISKNRPIDALSFHESLNMLRHRGPDYTGELFHAPITVSDGSIIYVASGHQRLSIIDLEPRAHQPFSFAETSIVFNGELYNFRELRNDLDTDLQRFSTQSDTEVLIRGLNRHGADFLTRANGMWAFSYFDPARRRLLLSRDRYGKKPLFFFMDKYCICISSSIASITAYLGIRPEVRDGQIEQFLLTGYIFPHAGRQTYLQNINQVPSGSTVEINLDEWTMTDTPFLDFSLEATKGVPDSFHSLPRLLSDAVCTRLFSNRKMALLLSGGVDSSLILAILYSLGLHRDIRCYIGETGQSDDAMYAKQCVEKLQIDAEVINLSYNEVSFADFLNQCTHQEKPFPLIGSTMAMSGMYNRIAQDDIPVAIDGTGGDELFGGYWERYFPSALCSALKTRDLSWLWNVLLKSPQLSRFLRPIVRECLDKAGSKKRMDQYTKREYSMQTDCLDRRLSDFDAMLMIDISPGGRLGEWIWHNDRNAMMFGIENRSPLLDHRLISYVRTGYAAKFQGHWNKFELRRAFDAFCPLPTQWRLQKQGFRWNQASFMKRNKKEVLALVADSSFLSRRFETLRYVDKCRQEDSLYHSPLTGRLLSVAGIAEKLGLVSPL